MKIVNVEMKNIELGGARENLLEQKKVMGEWIYDPLIQA